MTGFRKLRRPTCRWSLEGRYEVGKEHSKSALARSIRPDQGPRPLTRTCFETGADLIHRTAHSRRQDVSPQRVAIIEVTLEVDRPPKAAANVDVIRQWCYPGSCHTQSLVRLLLVVLLQYALRFQHVVHVYLL